METKLIESYREYFRAVATPNREKPKEADLILCIISRVAN